MYLIVAVTFVVLLLYSGAQAFPQVAPPGLEGPDKLLAQATLTPASAILAAGQLGLKEFSPKMGPVKGGSRVTIRGMGLVAVNEEVRPPVNNRYEVRLFNEKSEALVNATVTEPGVLVIIVPPLWIATTVGLQVRQNDGNFQSFPVDQGKFYFFNLELKAMTPLFGPHTGRTNMTIDVGPLEETYRFALCNIRLIARFVPPVGPALPFNSRCTTDGYKIKCSSPPIDASQVLHSMKLQVSYDNGQHWSSSDGSDFVAYALNCNGLNPRSGPLIGGTKLKLSCTGLIKTNILIVKFMSGIDQQLASAELGSDQDLSVEDQGNFTTYTSLTVTSPQFARITVPELTPSLKLRTAVLVSLNGQQWSSLPFDQQDFIFYNSSYSSFSPSMKLVPSALNQSLLPSVDQNFEMEITGSGFFVGVVGEAVVKFVPIRTAVSKDLKSTTVSPMILSDTKLLFNPPFYPNSTSVFVSVAMNGQQFQQLPDFFHYYSVEAFALQPTSGPISGSLVTITGKGFLDRLGSIQAGVQCEDGSRAAMAAMRSMDSQIIVTTPPTLFVDGAAPSKGCYFGITFDDIDWIRVKAPYTYVASSFSDLNVKTMLRSDGGKQLCGVTEAEKVALQSPSHVKIKGRNIVNSGNISVRIFNKTTGVNIVTQEVRLQDSETLDVTLPSLEEIRPAMDPDTSSAGFNFQVCLNGQDWYPVFNQSSQKYKRLTILEGSVDNAFPLLGPAQVQTVVTLTGYGFHAKPPILVGIKLSNLDGSERSKVIVTATVVNSTLATVAMPVPEEPKGVGAFASLSVFFSGDDNPNGAQTLSSRFKFQYYDTKLSSMKPSLGPIKGGTQITLSGSGFIPNVPTTVRFSCLPPICEGNGAQVDVPGTVTSWNTMTAIVPELNVAIDWTVQVTFNGDFFVKMNNTFKTIDASLRDMYPKQGSMQGNTQLTVVGEHLPSEIDITVKLVNKVLHVKPLDEEFKVVTRAVDGMLNLTTPSWHDARTVEVLVSLNGQQWMTSATPFKYFVPPPIQQLATSMSKPFESVGHANTQLMEPPSED